MRTAERCLGRIISTNGTSNDDVQSILQSSAVVTNYYCVATGQNNLMFSASWSILACRGKGVPPRR